MTAPLGGSLVRTLVEGQSSVSYLLGERRQRVRFSQIEFVPLLSLYLSDSLRRGTKSDLSKQPIFLNQ